MTCWAIYALAHSDGDITAGTNELSDLQLEYLNEEQLGLQPADVPSSGRWPHIRPPRWPFNGGLVSAYSPAVCYV